MKKKSKFIDFLILISVFFLIVAFAGTYLRKSKQREEEEHINQMGTSKPYEEDIDVPKSDGAKPDETENDMQEEATTEKDTTESTGTESVGQEDFSDTLFVGDSRTIGLMEYGDLEQATFFADKGMSVFRLEKKQVYFPDLGKITFDELLEKKKFKKIYFMLGMNELGYSFEKVQNKYQEVLNNMTEKQQGAVIYLCANLHVTAEQSEKDEIYNNENVNRVNKMIAGLADNETTFYIDVNELFDDENGCLSTEYACDNFHVWGKYYADWVEWLRGK